jgi:hypothetical protein
MHPSRQYEIAKAQVADFRRQARGDAMAQAVRLARRAARPDSRPRLLATARGWLLTRRPGVHLVSVVIPCGHGDDVAAQ